MSQRLTNKEIGLLLGVAFFDRSAEEVAHDLIGCRLHWVGGKQPDHTLSPKLKPTVGYPAAVLSRSVEGITGPGRLTRAMGINGSFNGQMASVTAGVWFAEGWRLSGRQIVSSARIGADYSGPTWSKSPIASASTESRE